MDGPSLKSRAIAFAFGIGAVAFILAIIAGAGVGDEARTLARAVVGALICGVMAWACAERALASVAVSVDAATVRVAAAADGDLTNPTPPEVAAALPELANALDGLFRQVRANLDTVHALAMFDPVTQLANRTNFRHEAERVLRGAGDATSAALLFIDLDHFKAVNDSYGHAYGDQLLAMVASRLRSVAASEAVRLGAAGLDPLVGRLAGDEFTVLFPHVADAERATRIARAILAALAAPFSIGGHDVSIGASIGVALRPVHGATLTALMRAADVAMYHAKARGRAQIQLFSANLANRVADKARLESDLRRALDQDEFTLAFQPQVALVDGGVVAAEALLRWHHPIEGVRLPGRFLDVAEETGLIVEIGNYAIDATVAALAGWPRHRPAHRLAINLSPRQLRRPDFFDRLRRALVARAAPLHLLELELTETVIMEASDATTGQLAALRAEGATIAIDNFGAGYSNLSRLRLMPIDRIKLDQGLIADIAVNDQARAIAQAAIGLVHGLGCAAAAEGVETDEQIELLRVMGCDTAQGFAIARPMAEADYLAWIAGRDQTRSSSVA